MTNKFIYPKATGTWRRGFTLIEVMLGAALLSFIGLCVYGTFRVGMDLSLRMELRRNTLRPLQMSIDRIMRELEHVVTYDFTDSYPDRVSFKGQHHSLQFIARFPDGLRVIHYYLAPLEQAEITQTILGQHFKRNEKVTQVQQVREGTVALIREETLFADFLSGVEADSTQKDVVLSGLTEEDWQFFYIKRSGGWLEEWTEPALPAAVRIKAAFAADRRPGAPGAQTIRSGLIPSRLKLGRG